MLRFVFLLLALFVSTALHASSLSDFKVYTDPDGNIYLKAPDKLVLIHSEVSIPVMASPANGFIKLQKQADGSWAYVKISAAEFARLSLTLQGQPINSVRYVDLDGDGVKEIMLAMNSNQLPYLILSQKGNTFKVTPGNTLSDMGILSVNYELRDVNGDGILDIVDNNRVYLGRMGGQFVLQGVPSYIKNATHPGFTAGQFRVDESGLPAYSIPLTLPAGVAGVQPEISINFNGSGGDMLAGMGWSVSGMSMIARCAKTMVQDSRNETPQFTATDAYCLDGQRLIKISGNDGAVGAVYRPELDDFSRITVTAADANGPKALTVVTKANETKYYGEYNGSPNAVWYRAGSTIPAAWALSEVSDSFNNTIKYKYLNNSAAGGVSENFLLSEFSYAKDQVVVKLNYTAGKVARSGYQYGTKFYSNARLASIAITDQSQSYRHYSLVYDTSSEYDLLKNVQECVSSDGACKSALVFDYHTPKIAKSNGVSVRTDNQTYNTPNNAAGFVDLDGDSKPDVVYLSNDRNELIVRYSSQSAPVTVTKQLSKPNLANPDSLYNSSVYMFADVNGDLITDLIFAENGVWKTFTYSPVSVTTETCPSGPFDVPGCFNWTQQGTFETKVTPLVFSIDQYSKDNQKPFLADVDGDGYPDWLKLYDETTNASTGGKTPPSVRVYRNQRGDFTAANYYDVSLPTAAYRGASQRKIHLTTTGDLNGDGNTDAMVRLQSCTSGEVPARCTTSNQTVQVAALFAYRNGSNVAFKLTAIGAGSDQLVDVNRDGNDDLFSIYNKGIRFDLSKGIPTNTTSVQETDYLETTTTIELINFKDLNNVDRMKNLVRVMDLDMDGVNDLLAPVNFSNVTKLGFYKGVIGLDGHWTLNKTPQKIGEECLVTSVTGRGEPYCSPAGNYSFTISDNFQYQITDLNGDNMPDLLTTSSAANTTATWYAYSFGTETSYLDKPAFALHKITNGYGQTTEIKYGRMNQLGVYSHNNLAVLGNFRVGDDINITSSAHLVKQVISDGNIAANGDKERVTVSYQYEDFVVNKAGRGVQGFRRLTTIDAQSGISTTTQYEQQWPFSGRPTETITKKGDALLNKSETVWRQKKVADGGTFVYLAIAREKAWQLGSDGQLRPISHMTTTNNYDEGLSESMSWGNLTSSTVQYFDPQYQDTDWLSMELLKTTSTNLYEGWPGDALMSKRFGRLSQTTVTNKQTAVANVQEASETSRVTKFSYYANHGLLKSESIGDECTNTPVALAQRAGSNYCDTSNQRTVTYFYNALGLRDKVTITAAGSTRTESSTFSSNGRYLLTKTDAAGLIESYRYNGQTVPTGPITILDVTGPNNLTTTTLLNHWGEPYRTLYADGTSEMTESKLCASSSYCIGNADQFYTQITKAGAPLTVSVTDKFGRTSRQWHSDFNGNMQQTVFIFDKLGRLTKQSAAGEPARLTEMLYDDFGRLYKTIHPDQTYTEISYKGLTTSTRDEENYWRDEVTDGIGRTVETSDPYTGTRPALLGKVQFWYDAYGNQLKNSVHALNPTKTALLAAVNTSSEYDRYGRKLKSTDVSKGSWFYGYNGFGEQTSQLNGRGESSVNNYDTAGRLVQITQPGNVLVCNIYGNNPAARNNGKLIEMRRYNGVAAATCSQPGASVLTYREQYSFDHVGRPSLTEQVRGDKHFSHGTMYDDFGRVKSQMLANGLAVGIDYRNGYQQRIYQLLDDLELSRVEEMDAAGRITRARFIGGSQRSVTYTPERGFIRNISVSGAGNAPIYQVEYQYTDRGTTKNRDAVYSRAGQSMNVNETYTYSQDGHSRLEGRALNVTNASALGGLVTNLNESFSYDGYGNLLTKSGVGTYHYSNTANPYQLSRTTGPASGQRTYTMPATSYDLHGNLLNDGQRTFAYSHADMPTRISLGSLVTEFDYAPDNSRIYRKDTRSNSVTETWYAGKSYELIQRKEGSAAVKTEHRWYVGNVVIALDEGASQFKHEVLHGDAQGSTVAVTNGSGALLAHYLYDAWGKQNQIVTGPASVQMLIASASRRGYTGHENVEDLGIIHMNGRIYDPTLARFVQADPHIQAPANSQNYNRYSYVLNNPLSYTDPSGYFFSGLKNIVKKYWKVAVAAVVVYVTAGAASGWVSSWGATWGTAATTATATTAATAATLTTAGSMAVGAISGAAGGFIGGALQTGTLKGAFRGSVTGALAGGAGGYANFGSVSGLGDASARVGVAALGGCAAGEVSGGSCGKGARMAAMTQALTMGASELYKKVSTKSSKQTGKPYNEDGKPHFKQRGQSDVGSQLDGELYKAWQKGTLKSEDISWDYDKSQFMQKVGKGPYMDAFAEFHDGLHDYSFIPDDQVSLILTMPPSYAITSMAAAQPYSSYYHLRLNSRRAYE